MNLLETIYYTACNHGNRCIGEPPNIPQLSGYQVFRGGGGGSDVCLKGD